MSFTMRYLTYFVTLLVAVLFTACGGGGGSPGITPASQSFFTTAPADLTLALGSAQTFTVAGGKAPYSAASNNSAVAVSAITDSTLTLGAVSPGVALVTLRDASGATLALSVTVRPDRALFTTAPASVALAVGLSSAQTYTVGGGLGPYSVASSNPGAISAVLNGTNLTITGLAVGIGNVQLMDSVGSTVVIQVAVAATPAVALFTTAPSAVTLAPGAANAQTFSIGGGNPPYVATSSNIGIATVTLLTANTFNITGVAAGPANIVVRDGSGATTSIAVTVAGAAPLVLNPVTVSAFIGDTVYSTISGGVAPFTVLNGFPDVADVDIGTVSAGGLFTANSSGNVLRIRVKQAVATGVIVVKDSAGGSANFTLTATPGTNVISLAPSSLTIGEEFAGPIQLILRGAVGTTNIFSSNPDLIAVTTPVAASASGTIVTVTKTVGEVCTTGAVTITAIDANAAKAVALITVEDHGNNPDPCPPVVPTP
jgi:hypothetical protein